MNNFGEEVQRNMQTFIIFPIIFSLQVSFEVLQSSPQHVLKRKAETINNGLQAIEKMLQQKSENIAKAKEVQKVILQKTPPPKKKTRNKKTKNQQQ